jgi:hypothetical protein
MEIDMLCNRQTASRKRAAGLAAISIILGSSYGAAALLLPPKALAKEAGFGATLSKSATAPARAVVLSNLPQRRRGHASARS